MISHSPTLDSAPSSLPAQLSAVTHRAGYRYLVSRPDSYAGAAAPPWPLLLFLHGTAPRGENLDDLAQQGPTRLLADVPELTANERAVAADLARTFVVVAPQCPQYEVWDDGAVIALLDEVTGALPIDPARVYLTGLSMGGFGTWSVGMRFPQRFAALVPVCGGGRVADVVAAARRHPDALERLGVWAFHGAGDAVVPLEESARMIDALKLAGVRDARLTVYPEAQHDAWTETYANAEVYAWLLRHARR